MGSCTDEYVVVPDTYQGVPVTAIGEYAFSSVGPMPDEYNPTVLRGIQFPASVKTVGMSAFHWCSDLSYIALGGVESIGDNAFRGTAIKELFLPDTVQTVGAYAFAECQKLIVVTVGEKVETIGEYAFYDESAISTGEYNSIIEVYNKSSYIYLNAGSAEYGSIAECAKHVYDTNYGTSWLSIEAGKYLFYQQKEGDMFMPEMPIDPTVTLLQYLGTDTVLTLPSNINKIEAEVFYANTTLKELIIPDSVTTAEKGAFYSSTIEKLTIPDTLYFFTDRVSGMTAVKEYVVSPTHPKFSAVNGDLYNKTGTTLIAYAVGKPDTELVLAPTTTEIQAYAVMQGKNLTKVVLPDTVTKVGTSSFYSCVNLVEFNTGNGVTELPYGLLHDAKKLEKLTIGSSVTTIGSSTSTTANILYNNTALKELTIPANVQTVKRQAFYNCSALETLIIEDGVQTVAEWAFYGNKLKYLYVGAKSVGDNAFKGANSCVIVVSKSVKSFHNFAFDLGGASKITAVYYKGTAEEYAALTNPPAFGNKVHYYSATTPTETGKYWCYDGDGEIYVWPSV